MIRYAFLCLAIVLLGCRRNTQSPALEIFGVVPAFQLTAQTGQPFDSRGTLAGMIWVADFIFTNCPGPCPRMTSQMHQVQEAVHRMPNVRLVSFTVDPARDTPPVLAAYAKAHHAAHQQWYFLTGPQATLNDLCRNVFKLGNVDGSLAHSTRFILIDQKSQIRGYYDTSEPDSIPKLVADIHALARERT
ncbi:MAG: SCO family protein [Bryobacteraceae bacterium]